MAGIRTRGTRSSILHVVLLAVRYCGSSGETNVEGDTPRSGISTQSQDHSQGSETSEFVGV